MLLPFCVWDGNTTHFICCDLILNTVEDVIANLFLWWMVKPLYIPVDVGWCYCHGSWCYCQLVADCIGWCYCHGIRCYYYLFTDLLADVIAMVADVIATLIQNVLTDVIGMVVDVTTTQGVCVVWQVLNPDVADGITTGQHLF